MGLCKFLSTCEDIRRIGETAQRGEIDMTLDTHKILCSSRMYPSPHNYCSLRKEYELKLKLSMIDRQIGEA